ncbi:DNA repair protein Rad52 [Sulfurimonas sp. SWIR-19]|uniref:Rad52/Rad22 family DNA repair protein n=1 Tax=Sulfurimonas sp. SWIR-19 TaxID=2878390 RepID=UPI001CF44B75|nr:Rad52/Rad22 family DNA repair protein [Sulfurimonas sp. SWIR-19]UCN00135.1 DNA repair protein Rad52 [Sulfurimonas sp. SWIR-19]
MFNDKQNQVLAYELDSSRIKSRQKGNITLSYLEGFDIIETANKIFGYGNWSYKITKLQQVSQEQNANQNHIICYEAVVSIKIYDLQHTKSISREDVGFGTGIAKTLADAHEGGAKEAVTDAIKRTLRSFGNQFGNSLYDKSRQNHNQSQHYTQTQTQQLTQPQQYQQTTQQSQTQQMQSNHTPQDYASLYNLGLSIVEQGQNLIVVGDDIFAKKDSIKACGFRWDGASKLWYKPIEQQAA